MGIIKILKFIVCTVSDADVTVDNQINRLAAINTMLLVSFQCAMHMCRFLNPDTQCF